MKNNIKRSMHFSFAILTGFFCHSLPSYADINCSNSAVYPKRTIAPNVNITATYAGNDIPIGGTIYKGRFQISGYIGITCDSSPWSLWSTLTVDNEPMGAAHIMSTQAYGSGPVYPTNVSGVGIMMGAGPSPFSSTSPLTQVGPFDSDAPNRGYYTDFALIKTGPVASGAVVNASSFPHVSWIVPTQSGYTGLPLQLLNTSFTGTIQFITETCTTPDVNVQMGKYDIVDAFTKAGDTTNWVDASVLMQNCPRFSGYYNEDNPQSSSDSGTMAGSMRTGNILTISLTPMNPVNSTVIGIDQDTGSATGVGVQLGYTPDNIEASALSPAKIWSQGVTWDIKPPSDGRTSFKIPLAARYYQISDTVTPGKANTKVTFNIDYK
ncbi:TPA: fimbrial protein [Enterobacter hormaechei]